MLSHHTYTEAGGHPINEDAFLVASHPDDAALLLCVLADGQGGRAGGAQAAQLACATALQHACATPVASLARGWLPALQAADVAVAADAQAGFTTLIGFAVTPTLIFGASCGDSAVLLIDGDASATLTQHQAKNPPVGSGEAHFTPFTSPLHEMSRLLAMTDGVWKYVGWERVLATLRMQIGATVLATLVQAARLRSDALQDDFTAIWIGPAHEATT